MNLNLILILELGRKSMSTFKLTFGFKFKFTDSGLPEKRHNQEKSVPDGEIQGKGAEHDCDIR